MQPKINVITLGVDSLEQSLEFYRDGLGFPTSGIIATEYKGGEKEAAGAIVIFNISKELMLSLYPRAELAKDAGVAVGPKSSSEFSIGYLVSKKAEVDKILSLAQKAGAELTDQARTRPWGIYSGYFKDPDEHLWEVIWNPRYS